MPVVEGEEVVACWRGKEQGKVTLEDRDRPLWKSEAVRESREAASGNRTNVLLNLTHLGL